jgi:hypothetical protein
MHVDRPTRSLISRAHLSLLLLLCFPTGLSAATTSLRIAQAVWDDNGSALTVAGRNAAPRTAVEVRDAITSRLIGSVRATLRGRWRLELAGLEHAPCRVVASAGEMTAGRNVDNSPADCSGGPGAAHRNLRYRGPGTCLRCHRREAHQVFRSTHYQWKGPTPDMLNQAGSLQGKHAGAVNAYCGSIVGNWAGCSSCHIGRGAEPESTPSGAQLRNIDCLICHQEDYRRKRVNGVMVPDTENMIITMDEAVQQVHSPTRATCLQCHATAGGGDAVKRGDLALASAATTDAHYDIHMATTGADLRCQDCHRPEAHRFPGKGSDIRPTDLDSAVDCASAGCHAATPHDSSSLNRHLDRIACQTCHIPIYAKDADDTAATEATEIDRSWQAGSDQVTPPFHPLTTKANNLIPVYRFWNRLSDNSLLFDRVAENPLTGTVETSVPDGGVDDAASKLYPFKYKTSDYPLRTASNQLIALDTAVFFVTADPDSAVMSGLENMQALGAGDFDAGDDYQWVVTDTYQLLNHQIGPADDALRCGECHLSTARMDLQGELGYALSDPDRDSCARGCHGADRSREWRFGSFEAFKEGHSKHREKGATCMECHAFSR